MKFTSTIFFRFNNFFFKITFNHDRLSLEIPNIFNYVLRKPIFLSLFTAALELNNFQNTDYNKNMINRLSVLCISNHIISWHSTFFQFYFRRFIKTEGKILPALDAEVTYVILE